MKFNIGCEWRNFGKEWIQIYGCPHDHSQAYPPHIDKKNETLISYNVEIVK